MAAITLTGIKKTFDKTEVLKNINLDIQHGEFISLVGPSGCGKSTLLRIIAGLEKQSQGDLLIDDFCINQTRAADRNLSMVFQSYALYPHLTVEENIAVPLRMRQLNKWQRLPMLGPLTPGAREKYKSIFNAVDQATKTLEIEHLKQRKPGELSGGQRQRVALGRALVRDPAAFLLDEPLSNLDAKLRVHTRTEIAQLHKKLGSTFIYVTHDQSEAMTMSNRIAIMMDGEILQVASPDEIYNNPAHLKVAEFIGMPKIATLPAEADMEGKLKLFDDFIGLYGDTKNQPLTLGVRPEHLYIENQSPKFKAKVKYLENLGSETYVHLVSNDAQVPFILRGDASLSKSLIVDENLGIGFKAENAHFFNAHGMRIKTGVDRLLTQPDLSILKARSNTVEDCRLEEVVNVN